ncbi:hypothetical protein QCN14_14520 [Enterobacter roggenkampii]|uniref:hypothetical protein n=1 Tax=Enterobacter roggenkampii TaxID=1812935 RepID=UPI002FD8704D
MNNHKFSAAFLLGVLSLFIQRAALAEVLKQGHVSLQGEILRSSCLIHFGDSTETWTKENITPGDANNVRQSLSLTIAIKGCHTPKLSHHHADIGFDVLHADVITAQDLNPNYPIVSIRDAAGNEMVGEKGYQPVWHSFDSRALNFTFHIRGDSRSWGGSYYHPAVRFRMNYN